MQKHLKLRRRQIIIVLLFLLIFMTRLPFINNSPAEAGDAWRQADTESIARNFIKYRFDIFYPQFNYDGVPPNYIQLEFQLTTFIVAVLYSMFGIHIWLARIVPVAFFMLSAYFLYLIGKRFYSTAQALTGAVIYAAMPLTIYFSRTIMPEAALLCFSTGAFFFFLKWLENNRLGTLLAAAFMMCLAISQKPQAAFIGLSMLMLCIEKFRLRIFTKWQLYVFAAVALIPESIYFLWSNTVSKLDFVSGIATKHIFPQFLTALTSPQAVKFYMENLPIAFSIPVLVLAAVGLITVCKEERPIVYWAAAVILEVIFIVSVIRFKYYLILLTPILALLSGKIMGTLWRQAFAGKALLLCFSVALFYMSFQSVKKDFAIQDDLERGAEIIDTYTKPQDLVIIGTNDPAILSLSDRAGWRANMKYYDNIPKETAEEMDYFIRNGADYFLVCRNYINNDDGSYIKYLDSHFNKKAYDTDFVMYDLHNTDALNKK